MTGAKQLGRWESGRSSRPTTSIYARVTEDLVITLYIYISLIQGVSYFNLEGRMLDNINLL